jgi:hypothetical protein
LAATLTTYRIGTIADGVSKLILIVCFERIFLDDAEITYLPGKRYICATIR